MEKKEHLPIYGVGPLYVAVIAALTAAGVLLRNTPALASGRLDRIFPGIYQNLRLPLIIAGVIMIALGVFIWIQAAVVSKVDDGIENNRLVTTGVYAWVRNPIYSAFMILFTGILLMTGNAWLLVLPFVYWLFMTVLMKATEEKWLTKLYGKEYEEYCGRVNRCLPWFPVKEK